MQSSEKGDERERICISLRLYVAGEAVNSTAAKESLRQLQTLLQENCRLEIIDALKDIPAAHQAGLPIVPALIVTLKDKQRIFYGRLTDTRQIAGEIGKMRVV